MPKSLLDPMERGIARGWERRAARGDALAGYVLQRGLRARAEPALASAFAAAVRRFGGGPTTRLELTMSATPWVSGTITAADSSLLVRLAPDWLRRVGIPRLATSATGDRNFVVAVEPRTVVVAWRPAGDGRWTAHLMEERGERPRRAD